MPALAYDASAQRPPLANVEAEMALIAALMVNNGLIDPIADSVSADDFSEPFLGEVYALIVKEQSLGRAANPVTLKPRLEGHPSFAELGGMAWLAGLTGSSAVTIGARDYAEQIVDLAGRRRMVAGLEEAMNQAHDLSASIDSLAGEAESAIAAAVDGRDFGKHEISAGDALRRVITTNDQPVNGVRCGIIPSLDALLGSLRVGHFDVLGGRPGMGKTSLAVTYSRGVAERGDGKDGVLIFSLEMEAEELAERMAADALFDTARIPYEAIHDRRLNAEQLREVCRAQARLAELPIQIIDKAGLSIGQIRARVRRWRRRFAAQGVTLKLVIVDYLQLVRGDRRGMDRIDVVSEVSRALKEIAKDEQVGILALCQLSRAVEQRADKRPQLSDLRESGQIEQDADAVLFCYRPEYYLGSEPSEEADPTAHAKWIADRDKSAGRIELICAKLRGGRSGISKWADFLAPYQAVRG